jgi:ABC-type amino acid transport system permease subunit
MTYLWDYSVIWDYYDVLLGGMGVTLLLTTVTVLLGLIAGCMVAILHAALDETFF